MGACTNEMYEKESCQVKAVFQQYYKMHFTGIITFSSHCCTIKIFIPHTCVAEYLDYIKWVTLRIGYMCIWIGL